jgi:hypothetical protein
MFDNDRIYLDNGVIVDNFISKTFDGTMVQMTLKSDENGCSIRLPGYSLKVLSHFEIDDKIIGSELFHEAQILTENELREKLHKVASYSL